MLKLDHVLGVPSRGRFNETRLSLITPAVAGSFIAVMMLVPERLLPAAAGLSFCCWPLAELSTVPSSN